MSINNPDLKICVIIGASHAGVNCAFALRNEGWDGDILLFDKDAAVPYHRPPLSKGYLASDETIEKYLLKPLESYEKNRISLQLGTAVTAINKKEKSIILEDSRVQEYDKLVIAVGASPIIPSVAGIATAKNLFPLRTAEDVNNIREVLRKRKALNVVIIGGGYIGLETAASLSKLGAHITVLEREERILARVTAPEMSEFFQRLHEQNGVKVLTSKNVVAIENHHNSNEVICSDGSQHRADIIIVGVGIRVNVALAENADLKVENGICVDGATRTSDPHIFAIGDCTFHYNLHYGRFIRLECVQNAVEQAKLAAIAISGKPAKYNGLPWFWSDQYDVKLQMVGLSEGYDQVVVRREAERDKSFSVWYFKDNRLLAVDAVNNAKAYVYGTKFIKGGEEIDTSKLVDPNIALKPDLLVI